MTRVKFARKTNLFEFLGIMCHLHPDEIMYRTRYDDYFSATCKRQCRTLHVFYSSLARAFTIFSYRARVP